MPIASSTAWEVRPAGSGASDNNGGGYAGNSALASPTTPTVTASAGGSIAINTYYCVITYRDANGIEGPKSAQQAVTTTSTNKTITVTAPGASTGAVSYSVYFGTTSGGPYFSQSTGNVVTANTVITTTPPTTGTQPFGTDYSLQDSPQVVINNTTITTSITSNTITFTGYTPSAADVGNIVHMLTGTNITAGPYQITGFTSTTWTVTGPAVLPSTGTTTNATGNMGGAIASPGGAGLLHVAKNIIFIKTGTYTITSASVNVSGGCLALSGTSGLMTTVSGYQTTRGDMGTPPLLQASAISTFTIITNQTAQGYYAENISVDGANLTASKGFSSTGPNNAWCYKCKVANCTAGAFVFGASGLCIDCYATGCSVSVAFIGSRCYNCVASGNTIGGFISFGNAEFVNCLAINNTGANNDGFAFSSGPSTLCYNCTSYGNGQHGFSNAQGAGIYATFINCLAVNNGVTTATGKGYAVTGGSSTRLVNCAAYNNAGGNIDLADIAGATYKPGTSEGFITLGADPFINAAGGNFSLNNVSNGGALLRGLGFPGTFLGFSTTTTKPDIGGSQNTSVQTSAVLSRAILGM